MRRVITMRLVHPSVATTLGILALEAGLDVDWFWSATAREVIEALIEARKGVRYGESSEA